MIAWLKLTDEQRKTSLEQAAQNSGINNKAIEKDWWVTLTLKALFQSQYNEHLVFKGGTSLSKCWKLIERFSEDIDIGLSPEAIGMEYKTSPTGTFVQNLKKKGCAFVSNDLKSELEKQFKTMGIAEGLIKIEANELPADHPDTDPQTLYIHYKSLFDPNPYLADSVKIEVSVRSLKDPFASCTVRSLLNEHFPNKAYEEEAFAVNATEAHRTFLEKLFLLHEEFAKTDQEKIRYNRMSRHLYDLERMMDKEPEPRVIADTEFFQTILHHRKHYTPVRGLDYEALTLNTLEFIPPDFISKRYEDDYAIMREQMIYGEVPEFKGLINRMMELKERLSKGYYTHP